MYVPACLLDVCPSQLLLQQTALQHHVQCSGRPCLLYRWTQWIFLQLFNNNLAYQAEVPVNWCPALGTVLANEEIIDGKSERGDHPVVRMPMKQVWPAPVSTVTFIYLRKSAFASP